jgi:hypothetical protein
MTKVLADRLALLPTINLGVGSHEPDDGKCAMEAVAWLAGEKHSDAPACVDPVISSFLRSWNDALPNDAERNRLLRDLLPLTIGTRGTKADSVRRSWMCLDYLTRVYAPAWLDLVPSLKEHATALRVLPALTAETSVEAAKSASAAWDAARAAARDAAWDAARAAARAAARDAARAAAWDAARDAAWDAARAAAWDKIAPVVTTLQNEAVALVKRMCEVSS